jgi:hypothetical protein
VVVIQRYISTPMEMNQKRQNDAEDAANSDDAKKNNESVNITEKDEGTVNPAMDIETDFASRDHGRTTGRMIDHEPGTSP